MVNLYRMELGPSSFSERVSSAGAHANAKNQGFNVEIMGKRQIYEDGAR